MSEISEMNENMCNGAIDGAIVINCLQQGNMAIGVEAALPFCISIPLEI